MNPIEREAREYYSAEARHMLDACADEIKRLEDRGNTAIEFAVNVKNKYPNVYKEIFEEMESK